MKIALCNDCGRIMQGHYRVSCSACNQKRLTYHDAFYEQGTLDYYKWVTSLSKRVVSKRRRNTWLALAVITIGFGVAFNWDRISSSTYVIKAKHLIATDNHKAWR